MSNVMYTSHPNLQRRIRRIKQPLFNLQVIDATSSFFRICFRISTSRSSNLKTGIRQSFDANRKSRFIRHASLAQPSAQTPQPPVSNASISANRAPASPPRPHSPPRRERNPYPTLFFKPCIATSKSPMNFAVPSSVNSP